MLPDFSLLSSGFGFAEIGTISRVAGGRSGVFPNGLDCRSFAVSVELCRMRGDRNLGLFGDTKGETCLIGEIDCSVEEGGSCSSGIEAISSFRERIGEPEGELEGTGVFFLLATNSI